MKRTVIYFLFLTALNLLIITRLYSLFSYADITAVAYGKGEVAESALTRLARENESEKIFSEAVLWKAEGKVPISFSGTGREQIVSLYRVKGQQSAVFGEMLERGRYFTEGERNVCLLDTETARTIFGSDNVLGLEVDVEGKRLAVAGLLLGDQPLCVVPAGDGAEYDGIAAKKAERMSSSAAAFGTLEASLGNVGQQRIDGHLYYMTACLFYFLPAAGCFFWAGVRERKKRIIALLYLVLSAEVMIMGIGFASPGSDYLPSYWSDFDFFLQCFTEKRLQVKGLSCHQEFVSWQRMFGLWRQALVLEMMAVVLQVCVHPRVTGGR